MSSGACEYGSRYMRDGRDASIRAVARYRLLNLGALVSAQIPSSFTIFSCGSALSVAHSLTSSHYFSNSAPAPICSLSAKYVCANLDPLVPRVGVLFSKPRLAVKADTNDG